MKLDNNIQTPLYYQLENIIRRKIENGEFEIDEKIPSERDLGKQYGLSRMTVSKSINNLVDEGILYRKKGLGTFVSKNKIEFFPGLMGFTDMIEDKGLKASSKVISQEIISPNKYICKKLNICEGEKVVFTQRLRLANNDIINLEKSYVPFALCPELINADLSVKSIYRLLTSSGYKPSTATQEIEAILSDDELSKLLQINIGEAILKRTRVTYSKDIIIEYTCNYYRGNMYTLKMSVNN